MTTLAAYIAYYINEELERGEPIDEAVSEGTIQFAIDAYEAQIEDVS